MAAAAATELQSKVPLNHTLSQDQLVVDEEASSKHAGPQRGGWITLPFVTAITLASLGLGGTRYTIASMGADQFDKPKDQASFFNWFFFSLYVASIIGAVGIVYIQDNVGWDWGFGVCLAANFVGLIVFLVGKRYYRHVKPQGGPFTSLARVVVATIRKRKVLVSGRVEQSQLEYFKKTINH
ncbi:Proton-dependent oligopeptide transporter family [Macleaya cordata]|uniref:Proton-dependent oligopeptide transporter family n=1 Tax=Macleaya cordata TaxID=56857 RepID=A0A200R647_MACCD|nr:Proton-dependent oligopeptide transporter family [Macleaya cordata]